MWHWALWMFVFAQISAGQNQIWSNNLSAWVVAKKLGARYETLNLSFFVQGCFFSFHMLKRGIWDDVSFFLGGPKPSNFHSNRILIPCNQCKPLCLAHIQNEQIKNPQKVDDENHENPWFPLVQTWSNHVFVWWLGSGSKTSAGAESLAAPVATAAVGGWVSRQQAVHASVRRQVQHWSGMKEYYLQWLIEHSYGSYGLWNEKNVWFQEYILYSMYLSMKY